jgi:nicotinate-nucleotide adenylyltransferase
MPGHVHVSREAFKRLGLDRVWWFVSPRKPVEGNRGPAPLDRRMAAARSRGDASSDRRDGYREARLGTRYTGETIEALIHRYPGVRFVWLMGADNLAQFHLWQRWDWIMRTVPICVLARPGHRISARTAKAAQVFEGARLPSRFARLAAFCGGTGLGFSQRADGRCVVDGDQGAGRLVILKDLAELSTAARRDLRPGRRSA